MKYGYRQHLRRMAEHLGYGIRKQANGHLIRSLPVPPLQIDLGPAASKLIVFEETKGAKISIPALPLQSSSPLELNGWTVGMAHVNGESAKRELDTLVDFSANLETQSFSGDLYYEKDGR